MSATRAFRRMMLITCLTALTLSMGLVGPLMTGMFLHSTYMAGHTPDLLNGVILFCLLNPTLTDWSVLLLISLPLIALALIMVAGIIQLVSHWYRTRRLIRSLMAFTCSLAEQPWAYLIPKAGLEGKVDFIEVSRPIAFCYGWLRPRICLATGAVIGLNESEIMALLLHERYHLLRRDPLKASLSRMLATVFFFLPVARSFEEQYIVAREIEADKYVLQNQETEQPLLTALYKLILRQPHKIDPVRCGSPAAGNTATANYTDCINQRLDYLLSGISPDKLRFSLVSLFVSVLAIAVITTIVAVATWASASNMLWHQAYCSLGACPMMLH